MSKKKFFSRLSYSFGNEDWLTEHRALKIQPEDRVLCITASGDRPLNLLQKECKEMIALDANQAQNYLLELKSQALNHLDTKQYHAFLGITSCSLRKETLKKLSIHLSSDAASYWHKKQHLIHKGIIYQGTTERWTRRWSFLLRLVRNKEIRTLFSMTTLEEQRHFIKNKWNHRLWRNCFNLFMNRSLSRILLKDPGTYAYFDSSVKPGHYLYSRMINSLDGCLANQNALLSLVMLGKAPQESLPPYLIPQELDMIRKQLPRLKWQTGDIVSFLENSPENSFDKFSLSDVASYLDYDHFVRLLRAMLKAGKPNARFCLRQLMTRYTIPEDLKPFMIQEPLLEKELEKEDRAFVYHFTVGQLDKKGS